jgi:hypothetical protein
LIPIVIYSVRALCWHRSSSIRLVVVLGILFASRVFEVYRAVAIVVYSVRACQRRLLSSSALLLISSSALLLISSSALLLISSSALLLISSSSSALLLISSSSSALLLISSSARLLSSSENSSTYEGQNGYHDDRSYN